MSANLPETFFKTIETHELYTNNLTLLSAYSRAQIQNIEKLAFSVFGMDDKSVMELAGFQCFTHIYNAISNSQKKVILLCGPGNNGADGLVIARLLLASGCLPIVVVLESDEKKCSRLYQDQMRVLKKWGFSQIKSIVEISQILSEESPGMIVDALFGIGLTRPLAGPALEAVMHINAYRKENYAATVYSIDIPSGIPSSGIFSDEFTAVRADKTLSIGSPKINSYIPAHRNYTNEIVELSVGFPVSKCIPQPSFFLAGSSPKVSSHRGHYDGKTLKTKDNHKYGNGHVLIIGGQEGLEGALQLNCLGAIQSGAGLISYAPYSENLSHASMHPMLMRTKLTEGNRINFALLEHYLVEKKVSSILIGSGTRPGCIDASSMEKLQKIQKVRGVKLVFDGGALPGFADASKGLRFIPQKTFVTPHSGEFARMGFPLAGNPFDTEALEAILKQIEKLGISVVYKASQVMFLFSLKCSEPGHQLRKAIKDSLRGAILFKQFMPNLARAGSGDFLAGLLAGIRPFPHRNFRDDEEAMEATFALLSSEIYSIYAMGRASELAWESGYRVNMTAEILSKFIYL